VDDPQDAEKHIREIGNARNLKVVSLREITPSLEDIFVSVMSRQRVG
jgi:hypothetical protein